MSNDQHLANLVKLARARLAYDGPLHSMWDVVADAEELLADRPQNARMSREVIITTIRNFVIKQGVERARNG